MTCERCFQPLSEGEHGWMKCPLEPRQFGVRVFTDELPNGPYWCETLGHEPVWVESKSHLRREAAARGLENVSRHDDAYYARQRRLHDEEKRDTGRNVEY